MRAGHFNLATSMNGNGEHFVRLIAALDRQGVEQYVIVSNRALARRISVYDKVTVGPVVKTPLMAYCLMPAVPIVHAHERNGGRAALLMTLTRSVPYVLTRRGLDPFGKNPITRSTIRRAVSVICPSDAAAETIRTEDITALVDLVEDISHASVESNLTDNRIAAEHLRIYRRALDSRSVPALLL